MYSSFKKSNRTPHKYVNTPKSDNRIVRWIQDHLGLLVVLFALIVGGMYVWDKHFAPKTTVKTTVSQQFQPTTPLADEATKAELEKVKAELETARLEKASADKVLAERDELIKEQAKAAQIARENQVKAEAEAKAKADAELAKKALEEKEEAETRQLNINRMKEQVFDPSKNFNPKGHFQVVNEDALKGVWAGWIEFKGKYFPLITNPSGNPSPVKGDTPPEFLAPKEAKWSMETITLQNPRGSGSYTTKGWASNMKPVQKK